MSSEDVQELAKHYGEEMAAIRQRMTAIENHNEQLSERLDQLEYTIDKLVRDLPTQKKSKREKMARIVEFAVENGSKVPRGVNVTRDAAAGAASCSPRHALNLFDDLDEQFQWAHKLQDTDGTCFLGLDLDGMSREEFKDVVHDSFPEVFA